MEYKSCHLMGHGISIEETQIKNCCLVTPSNLDTPVLLKDYNHDNIDWEELFKSKREYIERQKTCDIEECKGCYTLRTEDWNEEKYISYINFNHWYKCNSRCIYCYIPKMQNKPHKPVYGSIKNLIDNNLFKDNGEITFQGGEPTILEEFEDLINLFLKTNTKIRIHSSGILYSRAIEKGLKDGRISVVISPDAGTKETYEKIKNVTCFEKVCENLQKYSSCLNKDNKNLLKTKYIIVPGYNDSLEEIDSWLKIVLKSNIKSVIVDFEYAYTSNNINTISEHLYMLLDYIEQKSKDNNIEFNLYDSAIYAKKSRKTKSKKSLVKFKTLYKIIVSYYKSKNKAQNVKYN